MNTITRTTHARTFDALNDTLKAAIHAHSVNYGLGDIISDVLMCCETVSVIQKASLFSSTRATLSEVYITPQWLVWAESTDKKDASAGSALLRNIDVRDYQDTASNTSMPDEGLNITGRYTDKNRTGITFIGLDTDIDEKKFRQVLEQAINNLSLEFKEYLDLNKKWNLLIKVFRGKNNQRVPRSSISKSGVATWRYFGFDRCSDRRGSCQFTGGIERIAFVPAQVQQCV